MNRKLVISALLAMLLTTGGVAFAQGYGDRNDRGRNEQAQRHDDSDRRPNEGRPSDRRDDRGRAHNKHYDQRDQRGAGPNHQFFRGERLPTKYRHRNYVVDDWRSHNLKAPPRGYHWVQTGADYVLVAIATGVILQLFLHNEYD